MGTAQRRPVRQHQSPDRRSYAREGAARSESIRSSSIRSPLPTGRRSRSCSRNCSRRATRTPNMTPGRSASARATSSERLRRHQSQFQDPRAGRPQRRGANSRLRIRRNPPLSRREVRRVPAKVGPERAETLSWLFWQMGSAPFLGGGFGHFFAYAPEKIRICDQPLRDGGEAAVRRPQPPPRKERIYRRPRLYDRRHRNLAMVRRRRLGRSYEGADKFLATRRI